MSNGTNPVGAETAGRILVVDDSSTSLTMMRAAAQLGHQIWIASDGQAALAALAERAFDLVLLDIVMPGLSGFDVIRAMKGNERLKHIPIVVISSLNEDMDSVARAIEIGADDFLPKSFDSAVFRARVSSCIERKRQRDLELAYLRQVRRLTDAAESVEAGDFGPHSIDLSDVVAREDSLGRLAKVFVSMAELIHERERQFRRTFAQLDPSYRLSGLVLVMFAAALWATVGVVSRLVPHEVSVPDEVYGFARTIVAGPTILLFAAVASGPASLRPQNGSMRSFLVFGVCCAIFQVCLFRSFSLLGVTITVFLTVCLPPVLAVAWTMLRRTERVSRHVMSALIMAAVGVVAFSGGDVRGNDVFHVILGLCLSVLASAAFVVMSQAVRTLSADHSPMLISGLGLVIAGLVLAPATILLTPVDWGRLQMAVADWRSLGVLLYLGLGPTALAYLCYCSGMARCRSAVVGLVASMIEPGVAVGLAFLFLQEILSAWEVMGCVLLFFAMLTLWLEENEARSEPLRRPLRATT